MASPFPAAFSLCRPLSREWGGAGWCVGAGGAEDTAHDVLAVASRLPPSYGKGFATRCDGLCALC